MQSAKEISRAIRTWITDTDRDNGGPRLPDDSEHPYWTTIQDLGDLIYYLEDECPKAEDGKRWLEIPGVDGQIRLVTRTGGEGQGDETYAIFQLQTAMSDDRHFRVDGYYVSHDGYHYEDDELTEVHAVIKPVVFWDPVDPS